MFHVKQREFELSEEAMNASEAWRLDRMKKAGLVKEEQNEPDKSVG